MASRMTAITTLRQVYTWALVGPRPVCWLWTRTTAFAIAALSRPLVGLSDGQIGPSGDVVTAFD
jgi:hypothetical protein